MVLHSDWLRSVKIGVIGLGYVGLPLSVAFASKFDVIGYDLDGRRIAELKQRHDRTMEVSADQLRAASRLTYADDLEDLRSCNCYIITVPTPVDENNRPDLEPLKSASACVGNVLAKGDLVIYESTVYPGATEEDCVPILECVSGLKYNVDFYCGYSPERINPGDKSRSVESILKITSGSLPEIGIKVNDLYGSVITAGTYLAENIKVAEAAKVIENAQRDLNIAFMNELAMIFNRMNIDTEAVLKAAGTKWNFLPFTPGLVGGHCIGVDPYYLVHKAQSVGHVPNLILAARDINSGMGSYVAGELVTALQEKDIAVEGARVLLMGASFKENCPDIRNSRAIDILRRLQRYGCDVDVYDPYVSAEDMQREYGLTLLTSLMQLMPVEVGGPGVQESADELYDAIVIAVAHDDFTRMGVEAIRRLGKSNHVVYDLKHLFPPQMTDLRL